MLADLVECAFVVLPGSPTHERLVELCTQEGFAPTAAEDANSLASLAVLVAAGVGIALVPASMSGRLKSGDVVYRPLDHAASKLPVVTSWRRGEPSGPVQRFVESVRALRVSTDGVVGV